MNSKSSPVVTSPVVKFRSITAPQMRKRLGNLPTTVTERCKELRLLKECADASPEIPVEISYWLIAEERRTRAVSLVERLESECAKYHPAITSL